MILSVVAGAVIGGLIGALVGLLYGKWTTQDDEKREDG